MLARQRQERILEALRASGGVRVADLTEQLQVSYMTIRRDLDALADQGLVEKVHGGGPVADSAVRAMHVDLLFMGVHGMAERGGFTTPNLLESETNRALVRSARRLVVVADHTKWGIVGLSTIAALGEADVLVTDDGLGPEARATLGEHVGELIVASPAPE